MTEKELHRLRRQDLLQLLLSQSKEVTQQQARIAELEKAGTELRESNERLKEKLNEKDALIEKLKGRLDQKDATIKILREGSLAELEEDGGGISLVPFRLEELFGIAKQAAEAYLREKLQTADPADGEEEDAPCEDVSPPASAGEESPGRIEEGET